MSDRDEAPEPCQICGRAVPVGSTFPLCARCLGTARAAGKQEQEARRHPDPELRHRRLPGEIASW